MPKAEGMSDLRVQIPAALKAAAIEASEGKLTQWVIAALEEKLAKR